MDLPSTSFSKSIKSSISHLISLFNLIEYQRMHKNTLILRGSTIIHLYSIQLMIII